MQISAKDVKKLRDITGAGMMDCKKALKEAEGDIDQAIDLLRKKGQKISEKRSDREANEGAVFILSDENNKQAFLVELNSETDFVARNDDFQSLGQTIANIAVSNKPVDLEGLKALPMEDGRSIADHVSDAMGRIGEKIDLSKYAQVAGEAVVTYLHPGSRIGVAVAFEGVNGFDIEEVGKNLAMQIAAMSPIALDKDEVPQTVIEHELEIGREQARNEGKPEQIIEKIATGKLNKFFKENTLLNQDFVKDTSKTVAQYIKEHNPNLKVKAFKRMQLGAN